MNQKTRNAAISARLLGALLAFELAKGMYTGGLWIMSEVSVTGKIARLASHPHALAIFWMSLAVLVMPYMVSQLFDCWESQRNRFTRFACWSTMAGGVVWVYLAYLSKNMDYANVTNIFLINGAACVGMAAVLAYGLNREQQRLEDGTP